MVNGDILKQATHVYELEALPDYKTLLFQVLGTLSKKPTPSSQAHHVAALVKQIKIDRDRIYQYNRVCGFIGWHVGLTAPQVLAWPLQMFLMSRKAHPFPLLGMIHVHNSIEQISPLDFEALYDITAFIGNTRAVPHGFEFDAVTEYACEGEVVWRSTMRLLSRVKDMPASAPVVKSEGLILDAMYADYVGLLVPSNQGRLYANVSGDYNPIHLFALSARLFGFKQAIAQGMWTAAKCLSLIEPALDAPARQFDIAFKRPVFLPSDNTLKYVSNGKLAQFELMAQQGSKALVSGQVLV